MKKIFFTKYNVIFFSTFLVILAVLFSSTNLTYASTISVPPNFIPGTGLSRGLVGWWTMDGKDTPWTSATAATTLDKSGNSNTGTLTNMAQAISPVPGKIGQGLKFDGSNDYITVTDASSLDLTVGSISFWMNPVSFSNSPYLIVKDGGTNDYTSNYRFENYVGLFYFTMSDGVTINQVSWTLAPTLNKWTYLTVTWNGSSIYLYADGVQIESAKTQILTPVVNTAAFEIGNGISKADYTTRYFNGSIDDVRIYNRALSATEIGQLYNLGATKFGLSPTKSLTSGLVGYWTFDGRNYGTGASGVLDSSGQGKHGSQSGTPSPTAGKIGQALNFDGTEDYVLVSSAKILSGLTNFSVAGWFKTTTTGEDTMYGERGSSGNDIMKLQITHPDFGTGKVELVYRDDAGTLDRIRTVSAYNDGKWHHVTLTKSGTAVVIYIDGASENTGTLTATNTFTDATLDARIGADKTDSSTSFPGYLDDVRIYNRALSATEITQLYNIGKLTITNSFTPSQISGLQMWMKADAITGLSNGDNVTTWDDSSSANRDLTSVGGAHPTYQTSVISGRPVVRFGGSAWMSFTSTSIPAFTTFIVYKITAKNAYSGPVNWRTAGEYGFELVSSDGSTSNYTPELVIWNGTSETAQKAGPTTYTFPYGFVLEDWDSSPVYFKNAISQTLGAGETNYANGANIGRGYNTVTMDLAELLVYDSVLSTANKASIRAYLRAKYGIY